MNNEDKAKQLYHEYEDAKCCGAPMARGSVAFNAAMEMAEWKDEQFKEEKKRWIEKAMEYLIFNTHDYYDGDGEFAVCNWLKRDEFIENFKQAMNEE